MYNAKHTPGPWFIVDAINGDWPNGCEICIDDVEGGNPETDYCIASAVHGDPETLQANARLIAAAPELLEALDELEQYARAFSVSGVYLSDEIEGARLLAKACDAIAKAKGE